ncbi:MAG TPA: RNA polymerase sigma factor [Allosphingosinicella sp.]|jgi:RNA polymerase sigma-70 factor (ECF subfamily)
MSCDPAACTDGELAALTLAGRKDAFATIMSRHRDAIYRLIKGHVGNPEEALDLVQDCFVSAYKRLDTYDQARPFRAWLARIAINKCRDWGRRRAVRRLLFSPGSAAHERRVADPVPDAAQAAADREELGRMWTAISELPRSLKEPLILRTIDGLSQSETAQVLHISEKAVETRVYRARKRLAALREASG